MSTKQRKNLSVVIPCYNAEKTIAKTLESLISQQNVDTDIIVIDDGSSDRSIKVIEDYSQYIRWETGPNRGACAARNRGLALARFEMVMFLDSDDYLEGPFLNSAARTFSKAEIDVAFGITATEREKERTYFYPPIGKTPSAVMAEFLEKGFTPPCATVWRTQFLRDIGGWKDGLRRYQDYELTFRALSLGARPSMFTDGLGVYVQHSLGNRISSKRDLKTVRDQAAVINFIGDCLLETDLSKFEIERLMRKRTYRFWQDQCRSENIEARKIGKELYSKFGGTGHLGSAMHCIAASLLGLPLKERLAIKIGQVRRRLRKRRT